MLKEAISQRCHGNLEQDMKNEAHNGTPKMFKAHYKAYSVITAVIKGAVILVNCWLE